LAKLFGPWRLVLVKWFASLIWVRDIVQLELLKYGNTGRLLRRLFAEYIGGVGGSTTQFIHGKLFVEGMINHVEVAWMATKDKAEAERKEKEFCDAYRKAKGRRPAWDRQR
jgi:hypothetical protein